MVDLLTFDTEVRRSIVQEITEDDNTHAPSGDAVHDALSEKVDKETGKGLFSGSYNDLTDKPTIPTVPSASTTTPSADTTNGDVGDGITWARSNHEHPKSSLYAEASHSHTSLENRLSALETDSGWVYLSLTGNFYNFSTNDPAQYRKVGNIVYVNGLIALNGNLTAGSEWVIGTLPVGYRPSKNFSFVCELNNNANLWTCIVKTNGEITFNRLRDKTGFIDGVQWVDTLKLYVTFVI